MTTLEVLVATMNQTNFNKYKEMNINSDVIFANQANEYKYTEEIINDNKVKMITTNQRGVGKNRNVCLMHSSADIVLFSDDDMTYVSNYREKIIQAFEELPKADVIIFSCNLTKDGKIYKQITNKVQRKSSFNSLKYGTVLFAARRESLAKKNIFFNELFGGGTIYGAGEDTLFLIECFNKRLKVYTHNFILGDCSIDKSTWFNGYTDKYFYDKGVLYACAFPKLKYLVIIHFARRLKKISKRSFYEIIILFLQGIKGYKYMLSYEDFVIKRK